MQPELVSNELSFVKADQISDAILYMDTMVRSMRAATFEGVKKVFRTAYDFYTFELAPNYDIITWSNDNRVDIELRRYFKTLSTHSPFIEDLPILRDKALGYDFSCVNSKAVGLGIAYVAKWLAISLPSDKAWNYSSIKLNRKSLNHNGIIVDEVQVTHASSESHIEEIITWIKHSIIINGHDIVKHRKILFPALKFCDNALSQLAGMTKSLPQFSHITEFLIGLELYCRTWKTGNFDINEIPGRISGESQSTMQQFSRERTFSCPGDIDITFEWHGRIPPESWRIYFEPSNIPGKMIIGYIGPHLRIVSDPT